jgi:integrase
MYSGLRVGEVIALQWDDIEKDFSAIHVNRTGERILYRDEKGELPNGKKKTHMVSKRPKTDHSYRTIPLPQRAKNLLKDLDKSTVHASDGLVFTYKGHMVCYNSISNALKMLIKKAKCDYPDYTIHGLRHTYGSLLIHKGVDIKIVSELLGHSDVAFTYNVYIGVLKEDKIKAVEVLNNLF